MKKEMMTCFAVGLAVIALTPSSAQAISLNFTWNGDQGYSAQGSFSYDQTTAPAVITEEGTGTTNALQELTVSFFNPSNALLGTFNDVENGVSNYEYLEFSFDTNTQQFQLGSFLDIGEDTGSSGEFYLWGTIGESLELESLDEGLVDSNNGTILVSQAEAVPFELESGFGLTVLGLLWATNKAKSKVLKTLRSKNIKSLS